MYEKSIKRLSYSSVTQTGEIFLLFYILLYETLFTIDKNEYIKVEAKIILSKRSNRPPCPGINLPLSFTPACRFNLDCIKSPKVPKIHVISAIPIHILKSNTLKTLKTAKLMIKVQTNPPIKPSIVLLGEILSNNFLCPNDFPIK